MSVSSRIALARVLSLAAMVLGALGWWLGETYRATSGIEEAEPSELALVATWVVALLCVIALDALRGVVRRMLPNPVESHDHPLLVLDARPTGGQLLAAMWFAGLLLSGSAASGGLFLAMTELYQAADPPLSMAGAVLVFAAILVLALGSFWFALGTVTNLTRLRTARRNAAGQS